VQRGYSSLLNAEGKVCRADRIEERRACIGKYDGKHPSLTCATTGAKIFIHSPHVINESDMSLQNQMRYLNIAKQITAVGAASLKSEDGCVHSPRYACAAAYPHRNHRKMPPRSTNVFRVFALGGVSMRGTRMGSCGAALCV
jgi:hypothetical protein